jgi:hypothetical protein
MSGMALALGVLPGFTFTFTSTVPPDENSYEPSLWVGVLPELIVLFIAIISSFVHHPCCFIGSP